MKPMSWGFWDESNLEVGMGSVLQGMVHDGVKHMCEKVTIVSALRRARRGENSRCRKVTCISFYLILMTVLREVLTGKVKIFSRYGRKFRRVK